MISLLDNCNDGWIPGANGSHVMVGDEIQIKYADGTVCTGRAYTSDWDAAHRPCEEPIAYRRAPANLPTKNAPTPVSVTVVCETKVFTPENVAEIKQAIARSLSRRPFPTIAVADTNAAMLEADRKADALADWRNTVRRVKAVWPKPERSTTPPLLTVANPDDRSHIWGA